MPVIKNFTRNGTVDGDTSGFGTTVFRARVKAEGNNQTRRSEPGPGASGSIGIEETATTDGPERDGFIKFSYNFPPNGFGNSKNAYGGAAVSANFKVGSIIGRIPGETGTPQPPADEVIPFRLGVPFNISLSASFQVPPAPPTGFASAEIDFSFSVFEAVSVPPQIARVPGSAVLIQRC